MICENTLKIRNFPGCLTHNEKEDFLRHFGATEVKIITSKLKQKSVAFARFESRDLARSVLHRIHQIKILDSVLYAEFAHTDIGQSSGKPKPPETEDFKGKKHYKNFITKINSFNNSVGFNQPPPSHLKYVYPKPNRATINNIAHALASVPKFYTQVLHLMNRMNLPPPFSDVPDTPVPAAQNVPAVQNNPVPSEPQESSESELESDPEIEKSKEIIPMKRSLPQKKVVKRPKFIKPNIVQPTQHVKEKPEDVFDTIEIQQRKIELKVSSECLDNKVEEVQVAQSNVEEESSMEVVENKGEFISSEELAANQIPLKDLNVFPIFKDYHPGVPTCKLYIKNIAKTVDKKELEYIYKRYFVEKKGEEQTVFEIRLMQEGRMKGQAFVTLDNVEIAEKALKETNGYILKDKPLVVVFARSAASKK